MIVKQLLKRTKDDKSRVHGDEENSGLMCLVTTGGINWQRRNARVSPSKGVSGSSMDNENSGTHGRCSVRTVRPAYRSGIVGEYKKDGDIPSQGAESKSSSIDANLQEKTPFTTHP